MVQRALAAGEEFAATSRVGDNPSESPLPVASEGASDALAVARSMARADPAALRTAERLQRSAEAASCGPSGWADEIVVADLSAESQTRVRALDGEPTTADYVSLNLLATVAALLDGSLRTEAPSSRPTP